MASIRWAMSCLMKCAASVQGMCAIISHKHKQPESSSPTDRFAYAFFVLYNHIHISGACVSAQFARRPGRGERRALDFRRLSEQMSIQYTGETIVKKIDGDSVGIYLLLYSILFGVVKNKTHVFRFALGLNCDL